MPLLAMLTIYLGHVTFFDSLMLHTQVMLLKQNTRGHVGNGEEKSEYRLLIKGLDDKRDIHAPVNHTVASAVCVINPFNPINTLKHLAAVLPLNGNKLFIALSVFRL